MFYWFEPVLYLDPVSKFQYPEITERPRYFVEIADNVGDELKLDRYSSVRIQLRHQLMDQNWWHQVLLWK
jgi:hypothetical protein